MCNSSVSSLDRCSRLEGRSVCGEPAAGGPARPQRGGADPPPPPPGALRPDPPGGLPAAEHHAQPRVRTLLQARHWTGRPYGATGRHALLQIGNQLSAAPACQLLVHQNDSGLEGHSTVTPLRPGSKD